MAAIGVILLLLAVFKLTQDHYEGRIDRLGEEVRVEKIRASKLEKIAEGRYQKIVADSLEKKELKLLVDSLKIKAENPIIVENIVIRLKDVDNEITDIKVSDSLIDFIDYYPSKEDAYIKYYASLNLFTNTYQSKFRFKKFPLSVVVNGIGGGLSMSNIVVPDFVEVESYDFQSRKLHQKEPDDFGWLAGAGYYNNLIEDGSGLEVIGGIRYKKVYFLGTIQTNSTVGVKTLIEF